MGLEILAQETFNLLKILNNEYFYSLEIIDALGEQIYLGELIPGDNQIELPKLHKGIYMVIVWGINNVKTDNFVVA